MIRLIESSSAQIRLDAARAFVDAHARDGDVVLAGASRGAVDDLARSIAATKGATIGLHRFSLAQLAARMAAPILATQGLAPVTSLGSEAVAARATFEAERESALGYFAPVAKTPGFSRALARTLQELRLAGVGPDRLTALPLGGADLATLLERFDEQFAAASATDRAALFDAATRALSDGDAATAPVGAAALLLLDVAIDSAVEFEFVRVLLARTSPRAVLITVPHGDTATLARLKALDLTSDVRNEDGDTDLAALRRHLFAQQQPPEREPAGDVRFFSAPGEGRECVEIARRIVQEARTGVRFDEMAVFVRAPQRYAGLLEHALARAIPDELGRARAWFDRGTRRPHPAGRAFLALLACACEHLSARRFAEYLSLGQVPRLDESQRAPEFVVPADLEDVSAFRPDDSENVADDEAFDASVASHLAPPSSPLAPGTSHLAPPASHVAPPAPPLAPGTSHLAPPTSAPAPPSPLAPRPSHLASARLPHLAPRPSPLAPRARRQRRRRHRRGHAARAVEVGDADRRIRRDRRQARALAPAADRPGERNAAPAGGRGEGRPGIAEGRAPRARPPQPRPPARVRAADHRSPRGVAGRGDVGRVARRIRRTRADGAPPAGAGVARARTAAADGCRRSRLARRSARRRRGSPADAGDRSAAQPLRARVRRRAAPGARADVPRRLRRRPGRADVPAASARRPDAARRGDAPAARRGPRAAGRSRTERAAAAAISPSARRPSGCGSRILASRSPSRGRASRASTRWT